ncbi:MAG: 50S ribosomal protein L25 [Pelovirga sp.]
MAQAQVTLEVEARDQAGKGHARRMRAAGRIPAVVYGKGMETTKISVDPKDLEKAVSGVEGMNTLITLRGAGLDSKVVVLKDAPVHALRRDILCADLYAINLTRKGYFMVPVNVEGISKGQKMGGSTQVIRKELEVYCLPTQVPQSIDINVEELEIGDTVHIEEITAPEGVELVHEVNFTVITVIGHSPEEETDTDADADVEAAAGIDEGLDE